jgi:hypothetical protein
MQKIYKFNDIKMAIKNRYDIVVDVSGFAYEFISEGPMGSIRKRIEFSAIFKDKQIYNLGFGDVGSDNIIDDMGRSNNSDTSKVLATVAFCVEDFLKFIPEATVFATGSTLSRTRLYRMAITTHIQHFPDYLEVSGLNDGVWEIFKAETVYKAFKVKKIL